MDNNNDIVRFEYIKKNNSTIGSVLIGIDNCCKDTIIKKMEQHNYKYQYLEPNTQLHSYLV